VWQHFDARFRGRVYGRGATWIRVDLPRAWCARSVSSFCVALFCKTSGSTRTVQSRKKKTVARLSESLRFAREMAESTERSTCKPRRAGGGRGGGILDGAPPLSVGAAARGSADWPVASDLTTARPIDASAAIVYTLPIGSLFLRSRTTTTTTTMCTFVCNRAREARLSVALRKRGRHQSARARAHTCTCVVTGSVVTDVEFQAVTKRSSSRISADECARGVKIGACC